MKRLRTPLLLLCLAAALPASATKYAGEFMAKGNDARPLAMGGAFTAIADDLSAIYYNPGGLAFLDSDGAALMHAERFGGLVQVDHGSFLKRVVIKDSEARLAFDVLRVGVSDIVFTGDHPFNDLNGNGVFDGLDELPETIEPRYFRKESDQEWAFRALYARRLGNWGLGAGVKVIYQSVGEYSSFGFGLDAGLMAPPLPGGLRAGIRVADLTGTFIAWSTGVQEAIRPSLRPGLAWGAELPGLNASLFLAADMEMRFEDLGEAATWSGGGMSFDPHLGAELWMAQRVAMRGGLDREEWTLGGGVVLVGGARRPWSLALDYGFGNHEDLDGSHRVGLSGRF